MEDNFSLNKIELNQENSYPNKDTAGVANEDLNAQPNFGFFSKFKGRKKIFFALIFLLVVFVYLGVSTFLIFKKSQDFYHNLSSFKSSLSSKNLEEIKKNLKFSELSLAELDKTFNLVRWMKFTPLAGAYFADFERVLKASSYSFEAVDMTLGAFGEYLDLLGFNTGNSSGTTVDRIGFITKALPEVLPKTGAIIGKLELVEREISQINPNRYPVRIGKKEVRKRMIGFLDEAKYILTSLKESEPFVQQLPYVLGIDAPRNYLIIFQNDKELRPTGGFMTAYSLLKVDKATFSTVRSDDIYNLDSRYKPTKPAPEPIVKYIGGPYALSPKWKLRDMNWYIDFGDSMSLFTEEIKSLGFDHIDGVIAVDTQVLVDILNVLGPIDVPGYGKFSNETVPECGCPQIIYELESFADIEGPIVWDPSGSGKIIYAPANWENRKKIIGPLMNTIASYSLGQPAEKISDLFLVFLKAWKGGHILFYFTDNKVQQAAKAFGITGSPLNFDSDYLLINDANLGGRKSNLYVAQEVSQEIKVKDDGTLEKTLIITYKNPEKYDGWLNSVLPNWVRIYVPKGSKLISIDGLEGKAEPYEEYGKTVFAGFFELRPQGIAKIEVKYELPFKKGDNYKIYIQKQPGKPAFLYTTKFGKKTEEFYLDADRIIDFAQ